MTECKSCNGTGWQYHVSAEGDYVRDGCEECREGEHWTCALCLTSYRLAELEPEVQSYIGPLCDGCGEKG